MMTSLEIALLVLTIEFALIALVILFRSYRSMRQSETKATTDATELVKRVSDAQESRRLALGAVFKEKYQYDGDELTKTVEEFMQRERVFYNAVTSIFLDQGEKKLSDLNRELIKVIAPWISITPKNMVDSSEVDSLSADNSRLESELREAKGVLEEMIEEYNRTFHEEYDGKTSLETSEDESTEQVADEEVSGDEWDTADSSEEKSSEAVDSVEPGKDNSEETKATDSDKAEDADLDVEVDEVQKEVQDDSAEPVESAKGETEEETEVEDKDKADVDEAPKQAAQ